MDKKMFSQYYLGVRISQNDNAIPTFDKLFKRLENEETPVARIIELGTFHGGLSVFLGMYSFMKDIPFITYDKEAFVDNLPKIKKIFNSLNVDYRLRDINIFRNEIINEVLKPGLTLLLCDGGDKINEFNSYAQIIKQGDIIMAHDYAHDDEIFEKDVKNKLWNWHEIKYSQIEGACIKNNLKSFMNDEFEKAVWVCKRK